MSENSPYRQGTDPMEVINQRIDNARFDGDVAALEHYKNMSEDMQGYLQERPLRKVEKGDQLYDQTHDKSLVEYSRDELVAKWAEAEDAGDLTQSSDVQDEIERRLESEKNMSDDLKLRMIDRLHSQKEGLRKNKTEEDPLDKDAEQAIKEAEQAGEEGDLLDAVLENDQDDSVLTELPQTPPQFTGEAPASPDFGKIDDIDETAGQDDEWFIPPQTGGRSGDLKPFIPMEESDINDGRPRPDEHPVIIPPRQDLFDNGEPMPEGFFTPEVNDTREIVDDRTFMDKVKDAKARVFATVTSSWMKTKDFFKETDEEGNERVNKKKVGVAAGIGVIAVGVAGAVLYAKYGIDKPRGGGNAMDSMESGPRPKVGPNGTEGAVQISEPKNPGVVSVPKGGGELAMPAAPKPSVNLEQAPWNVAHELAPGDELGKINETIERFNSLSGSNLRLNQVGDTIQIYNGNRALTPEQQLFFNEILSQSL